jgi:hypothetical protein
MKGIQKVIVFVALTLVLLFLLVIGLTQDPYYQQHTNRAEHAAAARVQKQR